MYRVGNDVKKVYEVSKNEQSFWVPSPIVTVVLGVAIAMFNGWALAVCLTGF